MPAVKPKPTVRSISKSREQKPATSESRAASSSKKAQPQINKAQIFKIFSLAVLLATTAVWAYFGAKIQQSNADQVVNALLFKDSSVLQQASFPGQHTFLLKWPLFYVISAMHFTNTSYILVTMLCVLATVAGLAYIIHKIVSRPYIFGTICLAIASCLYLVPVQSSAGTLLPVSMAMVTTRNLEYLFFIIGIILVVKAQRFRSREFIGAAILFGLLFISDKLFFSVGLGASVLALLYYGALHRWKTIGLAISWAWASVIGAIGAIVLALIINGLNITNLVAANGVGPYGLIHSLKDFALGVVYAVASVLTNMGANPAYDINQVAKLPSAFLHGLTSAYGFSYLINIAIVVYAVIASGAILWSSSRSNHKLYDSSTPAKTVIALVWALIAAIGLFIISNHYFAVDARYLGLAPFTLFIAIAFYVRNKHPNTQFNRFLVLALLLSIAIGYFGFMSIYKTQTQALKDINQRNQKVAQVLNDRNSDNLIGDYWRVVPIKQVQGSNLNVVPLESCNKTRQVLNSTARNPDLKRHSFAYLLTIDGGLTDFKSCSLNQVITQYGRPNASTLISGNLSIPKELVLYYDGGTHKKNPNKPAKTTAISTVLPVNADTLTSTRCIGPTIMNIVAHQDDDLLFMNPDTAQHIAEGYCVRTIYLTAGEAGSKGYYYASREQGAQAAYDKMLGKKSVWINRIVRLASNQYVTISNPKDNPRISLIFMHLPDGNMLGQGFGNYGNVSLAKLNSGSIKSIHSIDKQSNYTLNQLVDALAQLIWLYEPSEFNTQSSLAGNKAKDHSDHRTVGLIATKAIKQYNSQQYRGAVFIPINYYVGYPIHDRTGNLKSAQFDQKMDIFMEYAAHDGAVCKNRARCSNDPAYGAYLRRQYEHSN